MIHRTGIAAFCVACVALAAPVAALANSALGNQAMTRFTVSDRCAQQAQKAFPDFTADSIAKRDAMLKKCLAANNLAPRAPEFPAAVPKP